MNVAVRAAISDGSSQLINMIFLVPLRQVFIADFTVISQIYKHRASTVNNCAILPINQAKAD